MKIITSFRALPLVVCSFAVLAGQETGKWYPVEVGKKYLLSSHDNPKYLFGASRTNGSVELLLLETKGVCQYQDARGGYGSDSIKIESRVIQADTVCIGDLKYYTPTSDDSKLFTRIMLQRDGVIRVEHSGDVFYFNTKGYRAVESELDNKY